jgi:UPF0042 nucleotide-binding protein
MEIVIITGLSGAGKSLAVDCFEDMGYYCIDNMPPSLIQHFIDLIRQGKTTIDKAAFVVDIRGGAFFDDLNKSLADLEREEDICSRILFLDASEEVLLRRFNETRRAHPLSAGTTTAEAIRAEREKLQPLKRLAEHVIDTSGLNNAALSHVIREILSGPGEQGIFRFVVQSFGYKYGTPRDADTIWDMRFIPNPFYVDELKHHTGNDEAVREYVMRAPESRWFIDSVTEMIAKLKPAYIREGKNSMNLAFGCTGGQHRSVAMANLMAARLKAAGEDVVLNHRDIS